MNANPHPGVLPNQLLPPTHIDKFRSPYYPLHSMSANRPVFSLLIAATLVVGVIMVLTRFGVVKVKEESMQPTLSDGQWVIVLRGEKRVHAGDIAVFISPDDGKLAVKRCILDEEEAVEIEHGWLKTQWGVWFLTGPQWEQLKSSQQIPKGYVFLVGDNQFRSLDSRNYGFVPRKQLMGRVLMKKRNGNPDD